MQRPAPNCLIARFASVLALALVCIPSPSHANWSPFPDGVRLSTTPAYTQVRTASDGQGGMYVAWRDSLGPDVNNPLWVQHLDYGGNPLWPPPGIKINDGGYPSSRPHYMQIDVCPDNAGGVFVAYEDYFVDIIGSGTRTWLTRLDASGATMSGFPVQLNIAAPNNANTAQHPAVASDGAGNAVVAWSDQRNSVSACVPVFPSDAPVFNQLLAQKVDATGHKFWTNGGVPVSLHDDLATDLNNEPELKPAPSGGGAYFVWTGFSSTCEKSEIRIQRLDASGLPQFDPNGLPLYSKGVPMAQAIATGSDCLVTISDLLVPSVASVRRIASNGGTVWNQSVDSNTASYPTNAAPDGLGGVLYAWFSGNPYGLFVQDIDANGNLLLPSYSTSARGTFCPGVPFWSPGPCVVSDGKGGALVAAASTGMNPSLLQVHVQGASATGRLAFQTAGLLASSPGQSATLLSGVPGYLNNGLFAWGNGNGAFAQQVSLSDLDATTTPPGWAGPLVPRSANNASTSAVGAMAMIEGEPTYLNWVVTQRGPNPTPAFQSRVYLDGGYFWGLNVPDGAGPGFYRSLNIGPTFPIPGGPHTLTLYTDWQGTPDFSIDEANEADDVWSNQWVWEPAWVTPSPKLDGPIGAIGNLPKPDGTGHKFHVGMGSANTWVVSDAARRGPTFDPATGAVLGYGDSYGLQLYDLPAGTPEFTHRVAESHRGFNGTNFIVGATPTAVESLYTLEVRDSVQDANPDSCWFDLEVAGPHVGPAAASSWLGQSMAPGGLADVYLLNASPRQFVRLSLREREGPPDPGPLHDLAFEVFPPVAGAVYARGGGMASHPSAEAIDTLTFVATQSGPYVVVVYRKQGDRAGAAVAYDFQSSSTQTLEAPEGAPRELSFARATPNPSSGPMELVFALPAPGPASLAIFDVNGRCVRELLAGVQESGEHRVSWDIARQDGSRVGPGLYFARLTFAGRTLVHRLTLLR